VRNENRQGDSFVVTIFALGAALLYGCADFLGGVATRQARALAILPASALAGLAIVLVAALAAAEPVRGAGLAWGLAAGAVGGVGLIIFYAGLAEGPMTIVAPTSALTATVLPVAVSVAEGERASPLVYIGALICLAAVVLVSTTGHPAATGNPAAASHPPATGNPAVASIPAGTGDTAASGTPARGFHFRAVGYGLAAGATFGLFFLFLRNAGQSGAFWPIVASRLTGFLIIVFVAAVTRTRPVIASGGPQLLLATFGSGTLDATANVSYVLATRAGLFGLAVVLTSLYPGVTVMLARFVLGERLRLLQVTGLLLAAAGVVMVTV